MIFKTRELQKFIEAIKKTNGKYKLNNVFYGRKERLTKITPPESNKLDWLEATLNDPIFIFEYEQGKFQANNLLFTGFRGAQPYLPDTMRKLQIEPGTFTLSYQFVIQILVDSKAQTLSEFDKEIEEDLPREYYAHRIEQQALFNRIKVRKLLLEHAHWVNEPKSIEFYRQHLADQWEEMASWPEPKDELVRQSSAIICAIQVDMLPNEAAILLHEPFEGEISFRKFMNMPQNTIDVWH